MRVSRKVALIDLDLSAEKAERYIAWLSNCDQVGRGTAEEREWLDHMAVRIATGLAIEPDDLDDGWFGLNGGSKRASEIFGNDLPTIICELVDALAESAGESEK